MFCKVLLPAALLLVAATAQNLPVPPLPYAYDALEPHIDEATMRVHHSGHHAAYTRNLNKLLAQLRSNPVRDCLRTTCLYHQRHFLPLPALSPPTLLCQHLSTDKYTKTVHA